jgi:hypothetical protein
LVSPSSVPGAAGRIRVITPQARASDSARRVDGASIWTSLATAWIHDQASGAAA